MKIVLVTLALLASTAACVVFASRDAGAHEFRKGKLEVIHPVALATSVDPEKVTDTAGFFRIRNDSNEADRLVSVSAPETSEVIQIYIQQDDEPGVAKQVTVALDIPANQETVLTPDGNHVLFAKLKAPLLPDSSFPAVLTFERAGKMTVIFSVEGRPDQRGR